MPASHRSTILGKLIDAYVRSGKPKPEAEKAAADKEFELAQRAQVSLLECLKSKLQIVASLTNQLDFSFECSDSTCVQQ